MSGDPYGAPLAASLNLCSLRGLALSSGAIQRSEEAPLFQKVS